MSDADDSDQLASELLQLRREDRIDCASAYCTYCREKAGDCRPVPVIGRDHIPALCDDCFTTLNKRGRIDNARTQRVLMP